MTEIDEVERHYHRPELLETILAGLEADDRDLEKLSPGDLEAVDQFHLMGREATVSLADLAAPGAGERVLDVGSGIGGAARYLAERFACSVVGVDLSPEFCRTANELSNLVGLAERTSFVEGSALELPVPAGSFDLAWTQHGTSSPAPAASLTSRFPGRRRLPSARSSALTMRAHCSPRRASRPWSGAIARPKLADGSRRRPPPGRPPPATTSACTS
jgi:SAM-dependent methyltransferase